MTVNRHKEGEKTDRLTLNKDMKRERKYRQTDSQQRHEEAEKTQTD